MIHGGASREESADDLHMTVDGGADQRRDTSLVGRVGIGSSGCHCLYNFGVPLDGRGQQGGDAAARALSGVRSLLKQQANDGSMSLRSCHDQDRGIVLVTRL